MRYVLIALVLTTGCSQERAATVASNPTKQPSPSIAATKAEEKKYLTHDELINLVRGKTQEEVVALIGKPNRTGDEVFDSQTMAIVWTYDEIAKDQFAKEPNKTSKLRFLFSADKKYRVWDIVHN